MMVGLLAAQAASSPGAGKHLNMAPRAPPKVPSSSKVTSSPRRPSVREVACLRCRDRRTFCTKERPICSFCRDKSEVCEYPVARRVVVNEDYLRSLEEDSRAYHELLATINGAAPPTRPHVTAEEADEEYEDDGEIMGPFTDHDSEQSLANGKPGSAKHLAHKISVLTGGNVTQILDKTRLIFDPDTLPPRRLWIGHVRLPPPQIGRRLFAAQYTYIGTIFAFTDPDSFDKELAAAIASKPDLRDTNACLAYAKVLVILAFGKMYSVNGWLDYRGPPGIEFFTEALQLLPDAYEKGSILCVETLALVGYFFQNLNQPDAAFLYIGMALRMAISLGLHQEASQSPDPNTHHVLDEATREHRRRVWWSIYSLDRILSVKSGNPLTIHDQDIGVKLPSRVPGEAEYCPAVVLRHYTQLSKILGEISKSIYRKSTKRRSARRLMSTVQNIVLALSNWETELPNELRFAPEKLAGSRECLSTFSHYYQCINMTARPLLFHVVRQRLAAIAVQADVKETDWKLALNDPTTVRVIEMCISAAKETIRMMVEAENRNLLATYGYMDGEHVFSAAIVLVMVCAAFPNDDSNTAAMNAGLDLLDVMAIKGVNSDMAARYDLLARLRSAFIPGEHPRARPPLFPSAPTFPASHAIWEPSLSGMTVGLVAAQAAIGPGYGASPAVGQASRVRSESSAFLDAPDFSFIGGFSALSPFDASSQGAMAEASPSYQTNTSAMELDGMVWEESFADANVDAGFEFDHWNLASG